MPHLPQKTFVVIVRHHTHYQWVFCQHLFHLNQVLLSRYHLVQLKNFSKTKLFFLHFLFFWGKVFCLWGDFLGLGLGTILVFIVKNNLGERLLLVGCLSRKQCEQTKQLLEISFWFKFAALRSILVLPFGKAGIIMSPFTSLCFT